MSSSGEGQEEPDRCVMSCDTEDTITYNGLWSTVCGRECMCVDSDSAASVVGRSGLAPKISGHCDASQRRSLY